MSQQKHVYVAACEAGSVACVAASMTTMLNWLGSEKRVLLAAA
jgi:hypothetical protein